MNTATYPAAPGFKEHGGTSEESAVRIARHATTVRSRCLDALRLYGPMSADEVADRVGECILTVRPRLSELYQAGYVRKTEAREVNASGHTAAVYAAQPAGVESTTTGNPITVERTEKPSPATSASAVYLAARYGRRVELCDYRKQLEAAGLRVQARWLDGHHQIDAAGNPLGVHGEALVEGACASEAAKALRARFAEDDLEDVLSAGIVVSFTEQPRDHVGSRGGRHVEFGMALASGARCIVVGPRENLFHWLPQVEQFDTWEAALDRLSRESAEGGDQ